MIEQNKVECKYSHCFWYGHCDKCEEIDADDACEFFEELNDIDDIDYEESIKTDYVNDFTNIFNNEKE